MNNKKKAIIIGAGPAGLTAAYELLKNTNIEPIVIEKSNYMGGISKTVTYKGNRIDIGGHRFFSKSDRVMDWWLNFFKTEDKISNKNLNNIDNIMLVRSRKSRIYYNKTFFEYPVTLTPQLMYNLGFFKTLKIGFSYLKALIFPIKKEKNLEDFFINKFGKELYGTFFESYTEKVWGIPCKNISAEWGAQRVKGVSGLKSLSHMIKRIFMSKKDIKQKEIETSLIAQFLYPKYGPGQMWETVAKEIEKMGGTIIKNHTVNKLEKSYNNIKNIYAINNENKEEIKFSGDYVFSSMPIKDFVASINPTVPEEIKKISDGLVYRDFITVGLLVNKLKITEKDGKNISDNWIYIQEPEVTVGRLQIFNNWSPYMVADPTKTWIGLEYFCTEGDKLWNIPKEEIISLAKKELSQIGIIDKSEVIDETVIKQEKAYPAYFGSYYKFDIIKNYLDTLKNVFFVGRNGMHRYNNQDHSMLSSMKAVDNIVNKIDSKRGIWSVNTEKEYHEEKSA